ncbi:hypothetical protein AVEN_65706-1 [Araneus ventricosus]|uniref:Uncharacterized protein n=1 Tax=Araneus ventricosus TaxID=182803 RepID=A0A4Y2SY65_ARAVE|nr:hypothetical protein AVEN_65706-1 [Araneus ventricosus]
MNSPINLNLSSRAFRTYIQEEGNPAVEGIDLQGPDASRLPNPGDAPYDDAYPPGGCWVRRKSALPMLFPHRREEDIPAAPRLLSMIYNTGS